MYYRKDFQINMCRLPKEMYQRKTCMKKKNEEEIMKQKGKSIWTQILANFPE